MAGWGNDSFDTGFGGGFGESSFVNSDAAAQKIADKVPIPATITDLCKMSSGDEKFTIGNYAFSTIRVFGRVAKSDVTDGGQSIEYYLSDYKDSDDSFRIIHYKGISPNDISAEPIVEGTDVCVVGKLRSFNERFGIVAFNVREVENKAEIESFMLESKLARLYYSSNVPEAISSRNLSKFDGTMLSGSDSSKTQMKDNKDLWTPSTQTASSSRQTKVSDGCRGLIGQRAEIFKFLRSLGDDTMGASIEDIRKSIPRNVFNTITFDADIERLACEGLIYSTSDDDHYAANA